MRMIKFLMLSMVIIFQVGVLNASDVVLHEGERAKFDYKLYVGTELKESMNGLEFVAGKGQLMPMLDKALIGMKLGEFKTIIIKPEDGYGPINPAALIEVPKSGLKKVDIKVGNMITYKRGAFGKAFPCTIAEIKDKTVVLDFNHPLAGKELKWEVEIVGIGDVKVSAKQ